MKASKSQGMMFILNMLITNGRIDKKTVIKTLGISNLTFRRYMQELRAFQFNFMDHEEVVYDKASDSYFLEK